MPTIMLPDKRDITKRTLTTVATLAVALALVGLSAELLESWSVAYHQQALAAR